MRINAVGDGLKLILWSIVGNIGIVPYCLIPLAVCVAFLSITLPGIGGEPLWLDEAETWMWASLPLSELPSVAAASNHSPTYYAFIHGWRLLGGDSEGWLRLPSILFLCGTIPLVYLIGRRIADSHGTANSHTAGVLAALVFATSPFIFEFAREARPYAMLTFFATAGLFCLMQAVTGTSMRRPASALLWLGYILSALLVMSTHHTAILYPLIAGAAYLMLARPTRRDLLYFSLANIAIAALYCGLFLSLFLTSLGTFEQSAPSLLDVLNDLVYVYVGRGASLMTLPIILLAVGVAMWKCDRRWVAFLLMAWLGLFLLELVIGAVHGSVFKYRTLIWTIAPLSVLVALGLVNLNRRRILYPLLAVLLAGNLAGVAAAHQDVKQPWDQMATAVLSEYRDGDDAVLFCRGYAHKAFARYWGEDEDMDDFWGGHGEIKPMPDLMLNIPARFYAAGGYIDKEELLDRYDRVWVVGVGTHCPESFNLGTPTKTMEFRFGKAVLTDWSVDSGGIRVELYDGWR